MTPAIRWIQEHVVQLPEPLPLLLMPVLFIVFCVLGTFTREAWTPWPVKIRFSDGSTIDIPANRALPLDEMEAAIKSLRAWHER